MPYKLQKSRRSGLWYVVKEGGGRKNKTPLPKAKALAYMRALYAAEGRKRRRA